MSNEEEKTREIKEVNVEKKGEMLDNFSVEAGVPSKGNKVTLKTYYNALDIDDAQKRIENTLKIREVLVRKGIIISQ